MPRRSPISRNSWRSKNAAKSLVKMQAFALDMDDLLSEMENLVQALRFMGHGMESHHAEEGYPISAVACTAAQRLVALRELWKRMIKMSVRS